MKKIVQKEDVVLRQIAKSVSLGDIGSPKIMKIIEEMKEALVNEQDGVGLAAPQIGYPLRIFIVAPHLEDKNNQKKIPDEKQIDSKEKSKKSEKIVFINPEILKLSKERKMLDEGCLSVRPFFGKIERSVRARIKAYDHNGKVFERGASGLLAQIFQHEVDHLNGILFIDNAVDIKEVVLEKKNED